MAKKTTELPVLRESPVFCVLPWVHLCASVDGVWGRCCVDSAMYYEHYYKLEREPEFKLREDAVGCLPLSRYARSNREKVFSLLEAFNSPAMKDTRVSMMSARRVAACQYCYERESRGGTSYRQIANQMFEGQIDLEKLLEVTTPDGTLNEFPCYLDIRFGNSCNLECVMCGFPVSSRWGKRAKPGWEREHINPYAADVELWEILRDNAAGIRRIYFAGGEPLLQPLHFKLLDLLIEAGCAGRIELGYNTNLTVLPEGLFDRLKKFKRVDLGASCDGTGEVYESIRVGAKWSTFVANVRETKKHFQVRLAVTPQKGNVANLEQLIEWAVGEGCEIDLTNILLYPEELCLRALGVEERAFYAEKFRAMSLAYRQRGYEKICADLEALVRFLRPDGSLAAHDSRAAG